MKMNLDHITVTTRPCISCGQRTTLEVPKGAFLRWERGELVQNAFPDWTADQRELLITGTHGACWDKMFGGDDE